MTCEVIIYVFFFFEELLSHVHEWKANFIFFFLTVQFSWKKKQLNSITNQPRLKMVELN